jgi:hypothetical protein
MHLALNNLDFGLEPVSTLKNSLKSDFIIFLKSLLLQANQMRFHIKAYFCGSIKIISGLQ